MGVLVGVWVQTPFHLWLKCCALISCQPRHGPTGPQAHIFCGLIEDWVALMQRGHAGKLGFPLPHSPSHIKGAPAVGQGAPPPPALGSCRPSPSSWRPLNPGPRGEPCPTGLYPTCYSDGHASFPHLQTGPGWPFSTDLPLAWLLPGLPLLCLSSVRFSDVRSRPMTSVQSLPPSPP